MGTSKPQSNGLYSNTVIGTLAVDGWAVTFCTTRRAAAPPSPSRSEDTAHLVCQLSIYNSFPVIRTTIIKNLHFTYPGLHYLFALGTPLWQFKPQVQKNRRFHVPQPTFLFPQGLEMPLRLSRNLLHRWKDNSMLAKPHTACTIYLQQFPSFEPQVQKIAVFTYRSTHFCFHWRRSCDFHAICCMDGKTIQCLPNPSQRILIYVQ